MSPGIAAGLSRMSLWMDEIVFGESPRWHDGRLWFSDWGAGRIWSVTAGAEPVLEAEVEQLMCIDFLPDGRLLTVRGSWHEAIRRNILRPEQCRAWKARY